MSRFKNRILARLFTRFNSLAQMSASKVPSITFGDETPWTPFTKELSRSKVALVTTAGVHLRGQRPFDMDDKDGDPSYREIPSSVDVSELTITHDYYDHSDADRDINIVFPLERLKELAVDGVIGGLAETNYGFMGHIDGRHIDTLVNKSAFEVAEAIGSADVDVVVLTPG